MITKDKPCSGKEKINSLLLPLALLIFLFLFSAPPLEATNGQLQELQTEIERLPSEIRIATSAEAMHTFRERVSKLRARIEETAAIGLISPEDRMALRGRLGATVWGDSNAEFYIPVDRSMPSLEGRYEAILAAARDVSLRYSGQSKLEKLRPLIERFNLLREDVERAYYQGLISEGQRNALRQRIEQEQRRLEGEISSLEAQPREVPVTPAPAPEGGPPQVGPPTPEPTPEPPRIEPRPPRRREPSPTPAPARTSQELLESHLAEATTDFYNARGRGDRPGMEGARQRVEDARRALESINLTPEKRAEIERGIAELLEIMDREMGQPTEAEKRREEIKRAERPPRAKGPAEEEPLDLSGTWVQMSWDKPIKEWEIRVDKKGKLTLVEPVEHAPGKVVEFSGSVEGNNITVRHIIKDPDLVDPKLPRKVTETAIREYMPTWDLDLKVSEDGTTIEGKVIGFNVNYNPDTLEVAWVKPRFEKELVLKRKGELAKGPPGEESAEQVIPPTPGQGMQKQQAGKRPPGEQESDESLQHERALMMALNEEMERLELEWMRRRSEGERTVDPIVMITETSERLREALIRLRAWERPSGE